MTTASFAYSPSPALTPNLNKEQQRAGKSEIACYHIGGHSWLWQSAYYFSLQLWLNLERGFSWEWPLVGLVRSAS